MESGSISGNGGIEFFDPEPLRKYVDGLPEWKRKTIPSTERSKLKLGSEPVTLAYIDRVLSATGDVHMLSILYPDSED